MWTANSSGNHAVVSGFFSQADRPATTPPSPHCTTALITLYHTVTHEATQMMSETEPESIDVEQFANETVRITSAITAVLNSPTILTGEVSGSGKTIAVDHPHTEKTYRLDTAEIMAGNSEFRDSRSYTLYTREDFQNTQSANYGPGPQAGANGVSEDADLPEPTHTPVGQDSEGTEDSDDDPDADGDASEDAADTEDGRDEFGRICEGERVHMTGETEDGEELDATGTVKIVSGAGTTVELDDGRMVRKKASVIKAGSLQGGTVTYRRPEMTHMTGEEPDDADTNPGSEGGETVMTDGGEGVECTHCQAVDDPEGGISVRVETNEHGEHYTVCDICEPEDGEPMTDGGQSEVPPEQASEGDTIRVVYDSPRSDDPQERKGKIVEIELWDTGGGVDTIRFIGMSRECRIRFAPDGGHILEQKSSQWTKLGRSRSLTITTDATPDGGAWDPEPATLREGETGDMDAHARRNSEQVRIGPLEADEGEANPGDDADTNRSGRRSGYVSPDEYERGGERVDHAEQANRHRTISGGGRPMTDGGQSRYDCPECPHTADGIGDMVITADGRLSCPECGHAPSEPQADVMTDGGTAVPSADDATEPYDVKTIRVHEPERGRYVYVMVNRLDGRGHALGEMGFTGVYFQFSVMSQNADFRLTRLSAYEIKRDHPVEWFADSHAYRLIRGLDSGSVDWTDLADGDRLTPEDVTALAGGDSDE